MPITLTAKQKQRIDTSSNWTSANPVLLLGEIGIESNTGKVKLGDGSTAWTSLAYTAFGGLPLTGGTMTGAILGDNSTSASTPGYAFDGDANTGLLRTGADALALVTGGTAAISVDSSQNVIIAGTLQVSGTTTTVNSTTMTVADKNIEIAKGAANDAAADGAGITIDSGDGDKTITWTNSTDSFDFNQHINAATGKEFKINNVSVLSATALGSSVVGSSLTSVGTIASGTWQGTVIAAAYLPDGTTSAEGVVQLEDSTTSTSTTKAATPASVKVAKDAADAAMPKAGGTFTGDVIFDGDAANITFDKSTDDLIFDDDAKAIFGTSSDGMELYHDGSNSYIDDTGTGSLIIKGSNIRPRTDLFVLNNGANSENMLVATVDSSVDLYFDGSKKLATKNDGVDITGELQCDSLDVDGAAEFTGADVTFHGANYNAYWDQSADSLQIEDNAKIVFGSGQDLEIFHDGSDSWISHTTGSGSLVIKCDSTGSAGIHLDSDYIKFRNEAQNETLLQATNGGAVELYHNNVKKLNTESYGVVVQDDLKVIGAEGSHAQVRLVADEGDDNNDNWRLRAEDGGSIYLQNYADAAWETNLKGIGGGAIELYHNNALQCYTFDTGLKFNDDKQTRWGTDDDMRIFHDNTQGILNNATGPLKIRSDDLQLTKTDNEVYLKGIADGAVELYHNNVKKAETSAAGLTVSGSVTDDKGDVRTIVQNSQSGAYVLVVGDAGKHVYISTGGVTINNSIFSAGHAVTIVNNSGSDQTITQGTGVTLYNSADASSGNKTLAGRGMATVLFASASEAYITGAGLS